MVQPEIVDATLAIGELAKTADQAIAIISAVIRLVGQIDFDASLHSLRYAVRDETVYARAICPHHTMDAMQCDAMR